MLPRQASVSGLLAHFAAHVGDLILVYQYFSLIVVDAADVMRWFDGTTCHVVAIGSIVSVLCCDLVITFLVFSKLTPLWVS